MNHPKYLLLLGAGASYGSEADISIVPPLAMNLFDELSKFDNNIWTQIPSNIASVFRSDFENGMLELAKKHPHALPVIQRSMAAFFFRFGPTTDSLYLKLAIKLKASKWNGSIATLNYDRMVSLALNRVGISLACGSVDTRSGQLEICLPHGCCNLFCESVRGMASAVSMAGMNVSTNGPVISVDHPDAFWTRIRNDAFPPVMSYFEPSKFTTSGANFVEAQRNRLVELVANAKNIAVVGVQVREQDSHIWGALASTNASIYYCSGSKGATEYKEWQARLRDSKRKKDIVANAYWNSEFDAINKHIAL